MRYSLHALAVVIVCLFAVTQARAVTLGQTDTFETLNDTENWAGGDGISVPLPISAQQVASGGPGGAADGYLQIGSNAYHLGTKNVAQWAGDYLAAGITAVDMDVNHLNPTDPVQLRVLVDGPGGIFASAGLTPTLTGDAWQHLSFGLTAADLIHVTGGTNNVASTLSAVSRLQVRHDYQTPRPPGAHPPHITATLGLDNIEAVPEPASALFLAVGFAGAAYRRKRK